MNMPCEHTSDVLAHDLDGSRGLAHAQDCAQCQAALATLELSRSTLRADTSTPLNDARARMWANIEAQREEPERKSSWLWAWALGGATLAIALIAVLLRTPAPDVQTPNSTIRALAADATKMNAGEKRRLGPATLFAERASLIAVSELGALVLKDGRMIFEVAHLGPDEQFAVQTPLARIVVVGTRFTVRATKASTRVDVFAGRVRVEPVHEPTFTLGAGQSRTIRAPVANNATPQPAEVPTTPEPPSSEPPRTTATTPKQAVSSRRPSAQRAAQPSARTGRDEPPRPEPTVGEPTATEAPPAAKPTSVGRSAAPEIPPEAPVASETPAERAAATPSPKPPRGRQQPRASGGRSSPAR